MAIEFKSALNRLARKEKNLTSLRRDNLAGLSVNAKVKNDQRMYVPCHKHL